jgi:hypothetical protein
MSTETVPYYYEFPAVVTKTGRRAIKGDAAALRAAAAQGALVVLDASGKAVRTPVRSVGKSWVEDGREVCYGYRELTTPAPARQAAPARSGRSNRRRGGCITDGNCSSFGRGQSCGAHDCDGW